MVDLSGIALVEESELASDVVRAVLAYWRSKRRGAGPPSRFDLEPAEIPRLLPHLILKEVRRDPWDFRYRLFGTSVREHSRTDWTGRWMSEMPGQDEGAAVYRVARWVAENGSPIIYRPPYVGPHKEFKYCEAAVMPWSDADGVVDRVMVAVDFLTSLRR